MHHGFFLVVYKNGDWEKVPVGKVRYVPLARTDSTGFEIDYRFPKMKGYLDANTKPLHDPEIVDPAWR